MHSTGQAELTRGRREYVLAADTHRPTQTNVHRRGAEGAEKNIFSFFPIESGQMKTVRPAFGGN